MNRELAIQRGRRVLAVAASCQNQLFIQPLRSKAGWVCFAIVIALLGWWYFAFGGELIRQTNLDMTRSDQLAMMRLAAESESDILPFRSNYVQPLWPWLSRVVMSGDEDNFFERGRWLNLWIGFGMWATLACVAAWLLAPAQGIVVAVVYGFGVMLQRAHFFHPEPLLYVFFGGTVFFMAATMARSKWRDHAGWGICFCLASLAKGSTEPLLLVFAGATVVRLIFGKLVASAEGWSAGRHFAGAALAIGCAAVIMAPNLWFKWQTHGDPFFSPAKYWMWCDDWDTEAYPLTPKIQTRAQRDAFPPGELPTAKNYIAQHGWDHARERWSSGMNEMVSRFILPTRQWERTMKPRMTGGSASRGEADQVWNYMLPARTVYIGFLLAAALILWIGRSCILRQRPAFSAHELTWVAMAVALFAGYMALFGWYAVIGRGERFSLTLHLPLLGFALWWVTQAVRRIDARWRDVATMVCSITTLYLIWNAVAQLLRMTRNPLFGLGV